MPSAFFCTCDIFYISKFDENCVRVLTNGGKSHIISIDIK